VVQCTHGLTLCALCVWWLSVDGMAVRLLHALQLLVIFLISFDERQHSIDQFCQLAWLVRLGSVCVQHCTMYMQSCMQMLAGTVRCLYTRAVFGLLANNTKVRQRVAGRRAVHFPLFD
jgi:hypothetical protein